MEPVRAASGGVTEFSPPLQSQCKTSFMCFPYIKPTMFHSAPIWQLFSFTCQQAKEAFAAQTVPDQEGVRGAPVSELHVDGLRAQPHLQVAELQDWVAVALLQPIGELASAGRKDEGR